MDREVAYEFRDTFFKLARVHYTPSFDETMERAMLKIEKKFFNTFGAPDQIFMSPTALTSLSTMLDSKQGAPSKENDDE